VVPEYLGEIEEFRCELTVILGVIIKRLPLILERIEYTVGVVKTIIYFDKVICERLHTDQERECEKSCRHTELKVMRLVTIDQGLSFRDLRRLNKLLFHIV
jgi:hypothetical protein